MSILSTNVFLFFSFILYTQVFYEVATTGHHSLVDNVYFIACISHQVRLPSREELTGRTKTSFAHV